MKQTYETQFGDNLFYINTSDLYGIKYIDGIPVIRNVVERDAEPLLIGNDVSILDILDSKEETLVDLLNKRDIIIDEKHTIEKEIEYHYEVINKLKEELEFCNVRNRSLDAIIYKATDEEWRIYYKQYDEKIDNQNKTK